jgi:hypothetical protein
MARRRWHGLDQATNAVAVEGTRRWRLENVHKSIDPAGASRAPHLALARADLSALTSVAIHETSYRRGQSYLTLAADADARIM